MGLCLEMGFIGSPITRQRASRIRFVYDYDDDDDDDDDDDYYCYYYYYYSSTRRLYAMSLNSMHRART